MTERELERLEIVNQLIGNIEGVGESHIDKYGILSKHTCRHRKYCKLQQNH